MNYDLIANYRYGERIVYCDVAKSDVQRVGEEIARNSGIRSITVASARLFNKKINFEE